MRWLYIDIGGPIINDEIWKGYLDTLLVETMLESGYVITEEEFAIAREKTKERKASRPTVAAIAEFTGDEAQAVHIFGEGYERLLENYRRGDKIPDFVASGAREGLERLRNNYHLATLSNNISKVRYLLGITGASRFFDEHFISEEVGTTKPDEAIFRTALSDTGAGPREAMMVGDRLDNDIIPASRLGMKTALICAEYNEVNGNIADIICFDLSELAEILETDL